MTLYYSASNDSLPTLGCLAAHLYISKIYTFLLFNFPFSYIMTSKIIKNTSQKEGLKTDPWSKKEEDHAEQYLAR
ncbi:unnamed protein product, partial [Vitis vinifera]|uniref:Uncharacterized protein n=1 Tax=Vitis vinifera TaxID=29760 RepID=D7T3W7_VITVI